MYQNWTTVVVSVGTMVPLLSSHRACHSPALRLWNTQTGTSVQPAETWTRTGDSYSCFVTDQAFGFHHSVTRSLAAQNATRSGRGWWVQLVHIMTEENTSCFTPTPSVTSAGFSSLAQPAHTVLSEDSHILTVIPAMQQDSSSLKWGFSTSGALFQSM